MMIRPSSSAPLARRSAGLICSADRSRLVGWLRWAVPTGLAGFALAVGLATPSVHGQAAPAPAPAGGAAPAMEAPATPAAPAGGAAPAMEAPATPATPATPAAPGAAPAMDAPATPATPATPAAPAAPDASTPATPAPAAPAAPDASTPAAPATPAAPGTDTTGAATQPAAAPAEAKADQTLQQNVENFWHYTNIARYDLASAEVRQMLTREPLEVYNALRAESELRRNKLDVNLFLANKSAIPEMHEALTGLITKVNEARRNLAHDPAEIARNIQILNKGPRYHIDGVEHLRLSGEMAVPIMLDDLRDQRMADLHGDILDALQELGREVLNPLVAATMMGNDPSTLVAVTEVIGRIHNPEAAPYLLRVIQDPNTSESVKTSVVVALAQLGVDPRTPAGSAFYDLAQRYYYNTASITADNRNPVAYVWTWADDKGLVRAEAPQGTFNDIMAMRSAEQALKLGAHEDSASLWLAADNKREIDLKPGEKPSDVYSDAPADYFNGRMGTRYVNNVLNRALHDQNAGLAMKTIKSLQEMVGPANMSQSGPLVDAMNYPDRLVRFEAAMALGSALPQAPFTGQQQVIPLLSEAVAQTGVANVLILAPSQSVQADLEAAVKAYGFNGGTSTAAALAESAKLPSIDVILLTEEDDLGQVRELFNAAAANPRLRRAAKVVIVRSKASPWYRTALGDTTHTLYVTTSSGGDLLVKDIEDARLRTAGLPLDEKSAADYSIRAAGVLTKLAVNRNPVLDLSAALDTLMEGLNDKRPDNAKSAATVLGMLDSKVTQPALLEKAADDKTADDLKIAAYKALASSARTFGNRLEGSQVVNLRKAAGNEKTPEVRAAAAEAIGALNLPPEEIKPLILDRSNSGAPKA